MAHRLAAKKPSPAGKAPVSGSSRRAAVPVEQTAKEDFWELRLYVAGQTPNCTLAFSNLKKICEEHLAGNYRIQVVDLLENPQLSRGDQILAIPTLVRRLPAPVRRIIGDLSNTERTLVGLDIRPRKS